MAKYTDEQIKKALECCSNCDCKNCPCFVKKTYCEEVGYDEILDLINRQEAEIDELSSANIQLVMALENAKSEAIKEVFMKLEALCGITDSDIVVAISVAELKELYKEMVGEGE